MKKLSCSLVLAMLLLCGCSMGEVRYQEAAASSGTQSETQSLPAAKSSGSGSSSASASNSAEEAPGSGEVSVTQSKSALPAPSEQEVLYAYDRAVQAYGWFSLNTLPGTGDTVTLNDCEYEQVDYDGIATMNDLRTYLADLFSESILDQLLPQGTSTPLYRDIDGKLYVRPAGRGADIRRGAVTTAVRQESDTAYSVNVTVEILGDNLTTVTGMEIDSFPYELVNGRWVFTSFYLVN